MSVEKKMGEIFSEVFGVEHYSDELTRESIEEWDSFAQITLILRIEKAFGISIKTSEALELISAKKIREYLLTRGIRD